MVGSYQHTLVAITLRELLYFFAAWYYYVLDFVKKEEQFKKASSFMV